MQNEVQSAQKLFRFVSGNLGIYEAVDLDCPRNDDRRQRKPDGSWLPKVGASFPGAISFWTEYGLRHYFQSGLCEWHISMVSKPVEVLVAAKPKGILYQDAYQIICKTADAEVVTRMDWSTFSKEMKTLLNKKLS